ncbi:hypothetical protein C7974DRAFT_205699 [Boeremia exigua]|uniref:uncharacterized protein n=1 Tax=Boeremia exigua TaxID=749465 RepID=UPI001E8E1E0C|nr:uncharacterized protein C7974DRAFT_205699 [Boeremia exigua]KAH6625692.1 hypothetical protein C7974DRAFT_205699 [Boeremia exigua]
MCRLRSRNCFSEQSHTASRCALSGYIAHGIGPVVSVMTLWLWALCRQMGIANRGDHNCQVDLSAFLNVWPLFSPSPNVSRFKVASENLDSPLSVSYKVDGRRWPGARWEKLRTKASGVRSGSTVTHRHPVPAPLPTDVGTMNCVRIEPRHSLTRRSFGEIVDGAYSRGHMM